MWWWFEFITSVAAAVAWPAFGFIAVRKLWRADGFIAAATANAFVFAEATTLNNLLDLFA